MAVRARVNNRSHRWEYRVYDDAGLYYGKIWTNKDFRRWVVDAPTGEQSIGHYSRTTATAWALANVKPIDTLRLHQEG